MAPPVRRESRPAPRSSRRGFPGWLRTLLFISLFFWLLWLRGVVFESYVVAWRALIVESDLDPGINKVRGLHGVAAAPASREPTM